MSTTKIAAIAVGVPMEWLDENQISKLEQKKDARKFNNNAKSPFFGFTVIETKDSFVELNLGNLSNGRFTYDLFLAQEEFKKITGIDSSIVLICDQF